MLLDVEAFLETLFRKRNSNNLFLLASPSPFPVGKCSQSCLRSWHIFPISSCLQKMWLSSCPLSGNFLSVDISSFKQEQTSSPASVLHFRLQCCLSMANLVYPATAPQPLAQLCYFWHPGFLPAGPGSLLQCREEMGCWACSPLGCECCIAISPSIIGSRE